jgi:hypothetical protein
MIDNNIEIGECTNVSHIEHKGDLISLDTFIYKGCWNCRWLSFNDDEYMFVKEASAMYGVSEATIRNWCQNGKLNAKLCVKVRSSSGFFCGPNKIWLIQKKNKTGEIIKTIREGKVK